MLEVIPHIIKNQLTLCDARGEKRERRERRRRRVAEQQQQKNEKEKRRNFAENNTQQRWGDYDDDESEEEAKTAASLSCAQTRVKEMLNDTANKRRHTKCFRCFSEVLQQSSLIIDKTYVPVLACLLAAMGENSTSRPSEDWPSSSSSYIGNYSFPVQSIDILTCWEWISPRCQSSGCCVSMAWSSSPKSSLSSPRHSERARARLRANTLNNYFKET